jgi:NET1-associated nuclear protein 1 (U3 small nucleolar RNA-associated protein 17)
MSQATKRDAEAAFEGKDNLTAPKRKRPRNREDPKSVDGSQAGIESSPVPIKVLSTPKKDGKTSNNSYTPQLGEMKPEKKAQGKPHLVSNATAKEAGKDVDSVLGPATDDGQKAISKRKKKDKHRNQSSAIERHRDTRKETDPKRWLFNRTTGGIFIDQDPVITNDGQHLILPTHSEVQIYATQTSLLVRSLYSDSGSNIASCALSLADPTKLYVLRLDGTVSVWDWTTGFKTHKYNIEHGSQRILLSTSDEESETFLGLRREKGTNFVTAYTIARSDGKFKSTTAILQRDMKLAEIKSYAEGSILVAYGDDKTLVGYSPKGPGDSPSEYTWRELTLPSTITSLDAQVSTPTLKPMRKVPVVDIVVGLESGVIMQYEDLLYKLIGKEKNNTADDITARKLHWHRTAVNAVKWSKDENYIISGGNESVLVIWQLDTNQRQYLPHLSTSILNITVTGSSYALRLGDNSVMVLSIADLLPSANINGLALPEDDFKLTPMLLHPTIENQLLAAIPAQALSKSSQRDQNATLLQTYDINSNVQLSRQALARNITTAKNIAPTGHLVTEPDVKHMAITHDGKWLATVDEWQPPRQDLQALYLNADDAEVQGRSTETCLRIWSWNGDDNTWEQVNRIDEPHRPGTNSVLGLVAHPSKLEITSIGADGVIQIWTPKARQRNGVVVKNRASEQLYTWTSSRSINFAHDSSQHTSATSGTIAYSTDGSAIAASWSYSDTRHRFVHLLDPSTGQSILSQPDLLSQGDAQLQFLGRHLLCLSDTFTVFDTLSAQTVLSINLDAEAHGSRYLAVNKYDGTVAISVSYVENKDKRSSKILVLRVQGEDVPGKIMETEIKGAVKGLLASSTGPGYVVIDELSRVQTLRSGGQLKTAGSANLTTREPEQVTKSLDSLFGSRRTIAAGEEGGQEAQKLLTSDTTTSNATSESDLNAVLRFVSSAQAPTPAELLQKVIGVVGRKSNAVAA